MKRFLSIFIIGFCLLYFQAYSVEKMPFKPRWVSILKKGKFFKYKRREFSSPVIFEDGLYIGTDTGLFYRFNKDGDKVWRIKNGAPINSTALAIRSGDLVVVFYGDDEGFLHALNAQDGKELWQINLGSEIWSAPTFSNSSKAAYVFVSTMEGKVFCINPIDGHIVWEKRIYLSTSCQ
ncbi:MAG: PQQ-binding-like beta-propeller repeat protein [Deltaproteobacteria bacterium]|nr:MAG: PQQ-binding-like beta-propeller repeat protein [Deltaproteobacteria bacterium]